MVDLVAFSGASRPRVGLMIDIQQSLLRDVGVNLCCGQITMPEKFLHAPEVGSSIQQVGGEAVPQRMRASRIHQTGMQKMCLQQPTDAPSSQPRTTLVEEQRFFERSLGRRSGTQR